MTTLKDSAAPIAGGRAGVLGYGLGNLAIMLPSTAFSLFYSFYYIDTLGLPVALYTLARSIYVVWDAAVQPLSGYLSDRTRTRWGRRRPWIIAGIPFYAGLFILLYSVPTGLENSEWGLFVWFLAFQLLFETSMAIVSVNYLALYPELFTDPARRARVSVIQQAFYIVALLVGTAVTPILYESLGFSAMAIIYAAVFIVLMLVSTLPIRENPAASLEEPLSMRAAFGVTLRNRPFWIFNISWMLASAVLGLISASIAFFAKYVLGIEGAMVSVLLLATFVAVIPTSVLWYLVVRRLAPLRAYQVSIGVFALSVIPMFFSRDLVSGLVAGVVLAIGLGGHFVVPVIVQAQIIDVDAAVTGRRREGIFTAVSNFLVRCSALVTAVAFFVAGLIFGYVSGDDPGPDPASAFIFLTSTVPLVLLVLSLGVALLMKPAHVTVPTPVAGAADAGEEPTALPVPPDLR